MKELVTAARNVVNTDEIMEWLSTLSERYSTLVLWIGGPVRKWVNKNAPTVPFVAKDQTGLPEWLKKAMDSGAAAETVVLDEKLEARIVPVLDYMTELVALKPETNVASIGFEIAEARSIKWHADMAKKATKINPIPEDGAEIVKDYGDGWTWRKLLGKECLINEGEAMGHCVGRFGYYERILRDKVDIFSLRGPTNDPHVTIEASLKDRKIAQIKGRANQDVVEKYLPRVKDFLADYEWDNISFDGAGAIQQEVLLTQRNKRKPLVEDGTLKIVRVPHGWGQSYEILDGDQVIGDFQVRDRIFGGDNKPVSAKLQHLLARAVILEKWINGSYNALGFLVENLHLPVQGWHKLKDGVFKDAVGIAMFGGAKIDYAIHVSNPSDPTLLAGYASDTKTTYVSQAAPERRALDLALELDQPQQYVVRGLLGEAEFKTLVDVQDRVRKLQAGKKVVKTVDDEALLDSLLVALKQPTVAEIKAAYLRMKLKTEVLDSHMKQLGVPVSGRAINGIAAVLMCTLPIKNLAPFQRYVFHKPNLLTCWVEVLTKPDHILAGLKQYGLDEDTIADIVKLLRNEFMRLSPDDLDALDLDSGPKQKVKLVMQWVHGHRHDAPRSKKLWSQV